MLISKFLNDTNVNSKIVTIMKKYDLYFEQKYIDFINKYNGGLTPKTDICIKRKKYDVRGFLGFDCVNKLYDFELILDEDKVVERLIEKFFPIACNDFDDYYYLLGTSTKRNQVVLMHHDSNIVENISDSFEDMINNGKSQKIGHIRIIEERKNDMIKVGLGDKITDVSIACWQKEIDRFKDINQELIKL